MSKPEITKSEVAAAATVNNSLAEMTGMLGGNNPFGTQQISQTDTMYINNRWYLISNNRTLLSQMYVEHGIVQTLVDQPVEDALRTGFDIKTGQLSGEEIEDLQVFLEENNIIGTVGQASKWSRLYGGGAVILITEQKCDTPLDISQLKEGAKFEFRAVDLWELQSSVVSSQTADIEYGAEYYFYGISGVRVHSSRILCIKGKEAPSFIRPRLRGWGMSELERLVRSINSYLKNQDVVFELLDEAKVDVYKMKGFNAALMNSGGTALVAERIQNANMVKNFQNAITMDIGDEYEQKQISFSGLGEMLTQIRQGVAADLKMPMTKLFGISAAGFSTGEEDTENYNSMVEREVRAKIKQPILECLKIACQIRFGFVPDDLQIRFHPLRVISAEQEENIKDKQFNRTMAAFSQGLATAQETKQSMNKNSLLPVEVDETSDALPSPDSINMVSEESGKVDVPKPDVTNSTTRKWWSW